MFGDPYVSGGIKLFYFKYRNWSRFRGFEAKFYYLAYFQKIFVGALSTLFFVTMPLNAFISNGYTSTTLME